MNQIYKDVTQFMEASGWSHERRSESLNDWVHYVAKRDMSEAVRKIAAQFIGLQFKKIPYFGGKYRAGDISFSVPHLASDGCDMMESLSVDDQFKYVPLAVTSEGGVLCVGFDESIASVFGGNLVVIGVGVDGIMKYISGS